MSGLQEFAENVWIVDGSPVRDMGVMFTTRMAVVKLVQTAHYGWILQCPCHSILSTRSLRWDPFGILLRGRRGTFGGWRRGICYFPKRSYGQQERRHLR